MLKWLKFTFGSFFSNTLSKEGAKRSFWNVLFALFLCFLVILSFISAGYNYSITTHYEKATNFKNTAYHVFANEVVDKRIELTISRDSEREEVIATATKNGNPILVDTFSNSEDANNYKINDYNVIIDTRPSDSTFMSFSVTYFLKSDENATISAEDYRKLEDRSEYTGKLIINNETVDATSFLVDTDGDGKYEENVMYDTNKAVEFLDSYITTLNDEHAQIAEYNEIKTLDKTSKKYANRIYDLFIRAYYQLEETPTNIDYYQKTYADLTDGKYKYDKFFLITDIWTIVSFVNDKGIPLTYDGYYTDLADGSFYYNTNADLIDAIKRNVDVFFIGVYNSVSSIRTLIVAMNVFSFFPYIILSVALFGLLVYCLCKLRKRQYGDKYIESFKIVSSYLPISASFAGIISMICFFVLDSAAAYGIGCWGLLSILGFRTLALVIGEEIAYKKNPLRDNVVNVTAPKSYSTSNEPIDITKENIDLSNVSSNTTIITNDVDDDEDEKMELL